MPVYCHWQCYIGLACGGAGDETGDNLNLNLEAVFTTSTSLHLDTMGCGDLVFHVCSTTSNETKVMKQLQVECCQ